MSSKLQISTTFKIAEGKLEKFKQLAIECMNQVKEKDTGTLRYDWFISSDLAECEVHEEYESSEAVFQHMMNLNQVLTKLLKEFPMDRVAVYGDPSPQLLKLLKSNKTLGVKLYSFFQGL